MRVVVVSSSLLKDWPLLEEQVVPPLLDVDRRNRTPSVWSLGGVGDAVAVVAAFRGAASSRRRQGDLRAFVSGDHRDLSPITFSLSDIRCVPTGSRSVDFERRDHRWVPGSEISRRVFLREPDHPVDLVVVPKEADAQRAEAAIGMLRDGGRLLFVGTPDGSAELAERTGLDAVDGSRRLYAKSGRSRARAGVAALALAASAFDGSADDGQVTLAAHQAQSALVTQHIRLARSLARRFSHHGESKDDLEQVALMALVKVARRYDPAHETSFSTYATASILGEIKRHFRDKTWSMRVPRSVQESYLAIKEARETLTHELSQSPTITQIATRLGISDEAVLEAMEAGDNYWPESLDAGVFEGETGKDVPVLEAGFDLALDRQQFSVIVDRLAPRERLILKRLYFDNWTQRQVADEIGVSQMQVSRLLGRLMEKLRTGTS